MDRAVKSWKCSFSWNLFSCLESFPPADSRLFRNLSNNSFMVISCLRMFLLWISCCGSGICGFCWVKTYTPPFSSARWPVSHRIVSWYLQSLTSCTSSGSVSRESAVSNSFQRQIMERNGSARPDAPSSFPHRKCVSRWTPWFYSIPSYLSSRPDQVNLDCSFMIQGMIFIMNLFSILICCSWWPGGQFLGICGVGIYSTDSHVYSPEGEWILFLTMLFRQNWNYKEKNCQYKELNEN